MDIKPIKAENIKRLLIRSTNWIGDAVMTTPAVRSVRHNFPCAHISILVKPWVRPVFENSAHVDSVLTYDGAGEHKGFGGKFRLAKALRKYRFDAVILLQNAFEAALITFLAGIPVRIGYNTDGRRLLLTHPIRCRPEFKNAHQTGYYLNIIKGAGLERGEPELYLVTSSQQRARARELLFAHGVTEESRLVGINPSATYGPAKQWPLARYAGLADKIQKYAGCRILVFGGPEDRELGRRMSRMMQRPPVDLAGKTELGEAMALIEQCSLFVTNDSGLMHVAAALNVPVVAVFGSTNAKTTGPFGSASRIVQVPLPCNPCLKPECPEGHLSCMEQIDVDMVFDAAKELL
ncbi:MAG: lipopolysaccharide heptosyltransferase II [Proteobacteria bacterium]|nr:lipopolysaccharide heptosyltransferase II [Pseudomonadota bacterium]